MILRCGAGLVPAILAWALVSCEPTAGGPCANDVECDALAQGHNACDVERGQCICLDDRGCGANELCNAAGACQTRAGCLTNDDCGEGLFCDILSGDCIAANEDVCTLDSHCAFGAVCDALARSCVPGCRDDADCIAGQGCVGAGFGRLGSCGLACTSDAGCNFGSLCNISAGGVCERDTRGPYCAGCSGGVSSDDCGERGNFCLLDTVNGGAYCGVDCAADQACPSGYECRDVIILPAATLPTCALPEACDAASGLCSRTGALCTIDEDCPEGPPGSDCPRADVGNCELDPLAPCASDAECGDAQGACLKQECREREGAAFGVCSCTKDSDCPRDRCVGADLTDASAPRSGSCELSGRDCFEDFECDVITCVEGGCLIGRNCKPASDRTCVDLLD